MSESKSTRKKVSKTRDFPCLVSVDWLQYYGHFRSAFDTNRCAENGLQVHDVGHGSKVFKKLYVLKSKKYKKELATIAFEPYSSVMHPRSVIIKLANEVLYREDVFTFGRWLMKILDVEYRGITRLDLSYDCNYLKNGLKPATLLAGYVKGSFIKKGCQKQFYLNGEQRYNISKAGTIQNNLLAHQWQGITWGKRSSGIQCQIYNKTKELREVKDKPWIREAWQAAGIDETKEVWRFEIRISEVGKELKDMQFDERIILNDSLLINKQAIQDLFMAYAAGYEDDKGKLHGGRFDFADVVKCSKVSRLKSREIFCLGKCKTLMLKHFNNSIPSSRYVKGVQSKLAEFQEQLASGSIKSHIPHAASFLMMSHHVLDSIVSQFKLEACNTPLEQIREKQRAVEISKVVYQYLQEFRYKHKKQTQEQIDEIKMYLDSCRRIVDLENQLRVYDDTWDDDVVIDI